MREAPRIQQRADQLATGEGEVADGLLAQCDLRACVAVAAIAKEV